jgi:hypothetical protein
MEQRKVLELVWHTKTKHMLNKPPIIPQKPILKCLLFSPSAVWGSHINSLTLNLICNGDDNDHIKVVSWLNIDNVPVMPHM